MALGPKHLEADRHAAQDRYVAISTGKWRGVSKSLVGQRLQQVAVMIKAKIGLQEALFLDCGGWEINVNEGSTQGQFGEIRRRDLSQSLAAFHQDMGDRMGDVAAVTMSESGAPPRKMGIVARTMGMPMTCL